jgi:hypothetical protein
MDIDFEKLDKEFFVDLDDEDIERLKSMSEEDITDIYETVEAAIDDEWERIRDEIMRGEWGDDEINEAKDWIRNLYFKEHPDEQERWDEDGEIDEDEFEVFLQEHNKEYTDVLSEIANDAIMNGGVTEQIHRDSMEKVSGDLGLPCSLIEYLYDNEGRLPLKE